MPFRVFTYSCKHLEAAKKNREIAAPGLYTTSLYVINSITNNRELVSLHRISISLCTGTKSKLILKCTTYYVNIRKAAKSAR